MTLEGYSDQYPDEESYLRFLEQLISESHDLLNPEGVFCLHLDWRMTAQARILCDRIFGKERFLNEIIWAYESGGRSKRFFPRKHDNILMYAQSSRYHFDLTQVPLARGEHRKNHMARKIDENGRSYSSIMSGGKEYRYYDDDPVYPGDVWTDIGFLQQKDPERTGYPTQKPQKLLERLLKPVVCPGDLVVDLCCGSGTTLAVAEGLGCRYAGMDANPEAIAVCQARLRAENLTVVCPTETGSALCLADYEPETGRIRMGGLVLEGKPYPEGAEPADMVEAWETGRIEGDVFRTANRFQRSFRYPALTDTLVLSTGNIPDLLITDAAGRRRVYQWKAEDDRK